MGSLEAGFNHARTITKAPANGWTRDKMIITKEYAPLGAKSIIMLDRTAMMLHSH